MNRDPIESLHTEASEHYLQGNFEGARRAWARVLEHDPADERAREGLRLCGSLADAAPPEDVADTTENVLDDLDLDLDGLDAPVAGEAKGVGALDPSVLDAFEDVPGPAADVPLDDADEIESVLVDRDDAAAGGAGRERRATELPDPDRQNEGLDFGDLDEVDVLAVPEGAPSPSTPTPSTDGAAPALDAAAVDVELRRRTGELYDEARKAHDEGRDDDALALLARLAILDDGHAEAQELDLRIRERIDSAAREIEDAIGEAIRWLEDGRYVEARDRLREVLARAPEHREAIHLLEEAEERLAAADPSRDEDGNLALHGTGEGVEVGAPSDGAPSTTFDPGDVDLGPAIADGPALAVPSAPVREPRPMPPSGAARSGGTTSAARRRPGALVLAIAGLAVLAAAGLFGRGMLFDRAAAPVPTASVPTAPEADLAPSGASGTTTAELIEQADRLAATAAGSAPSRATVERVADGLRSGSEAMDRADWEGAILIYNGVLELAPDNAEAAAGLLEAGRRYRERKAQDDEFDRARRAFGGGDYASALRILYRLPNDLRPEEVRRMKVDGWFNLGLVELRAGDLDEASGHFREVLAIDAGDARARDALAFADRYRGQVKDAAYYGAVQAMSFRNAGS